MIDWSHALDTAGGDRQLLADVLQAFQMEGPLLIRQLRQSVENADAEQCTRAAHTLKGCFRSIGALDLVELARHVEQSGRDATVEQFRDDIERLAVQVTQCLEDVAEFLRSHCR